jgi:hypothetical protein
MLKLLKFLVLVICLFFSSKADLQCTEGGGGMPKGSSSMSIGELWPDIDKLDEICHRGTFGGSLLGGTLHKLSSLSLARGGGLVSVQVHG